MSPCRTCKTLVPAAVLFLFATCVQTSGVRSVADVSESTAKSAAVSLLSAIQGESPPEPEQAGEEQEETFKHHTVSVLTRVVSEERADGGPAIGLDYEYRFHENWGVGAFAEYVAGTLETGVFGAMANFHPTERLLLGIGGGVDTNREETRGLMRVGGLYEFEAGEIIIAPAVYWDWIEGGHHALLAGINFGKKF